MVPQTYPSVYNTANGSVSMVVSTITDLTGLTRWVDYVPIQLASESSVENSMNNNGAIAAKEIASTSGKQAGKDFIRVYVDNSATKKWTISSDGYLPLFFYPDILYNNLETEGGDNFVLESGDLFLLEG